MKENQVAVNELSATNLKEALWETLNQVKNGDMQPSQGDAVASQAREIIRTVNTQLRVMAQSNRQVPTNVITFAEQ